MQARQLLDTFARAGLAVALTPDDRLKVTPSKALTDELRHTIRANKSVLLEYLKHEYANDQSEAAQELVAERAAIMQYDGGLTQVDAERLAATHTRYLLHHWGCDTCCSAGQGRGQRCQIGASLWDIYNQSIA